MLFLILLPFVITWDIVNIVLKLIINTLIICVLIIVIPIDIILMAFSPKSAGDLWAIMKVLLEKNKIQILGFKIYGIDRSTELLPEEQFIKDGIPYIEILGTKEEYEDLRADANHLGIWITGMRWFGFKATPKFIYKFFITNLDPKKLPKK